MTNNDNGWRVEEVLKEIDALAEKHRRAVKFFDDHNFMFEDLVHRKIWEAYENCNRILSQAKQGT